MANRRSPRRGDLRWVFTQLNFAAISSGGVSAQTAISAGTQPETIMRTRGELLVWIDASPAQGEVQGVGFGLIVMPEGQGTTVISSPISDGNAPFYWFEAFGLASEDTGVARQEGLHMLRVPIDSKAMRRVRPDKEVQLVMESVAFSGATVVNAIVSFRTLLASG